MGPMPLVRRRLSQDAAFVDVEMVNSGVAQYGQLLETWGAILNKPGLMAVYLPFLRVVVGSGSLDPRLKDASALLVGYLNGCRYTVSHRYASALRNGLRDDEMRSVTSGDWDQFDMSWRVALELTRAMTVLPPLVSADAIPQLADDTTLAAARSLFGDEQLVELSMSIAVWNALSRFHRIMGLELDMPSAPPGIDPE